MATQQGSTNPMATYTTARLSKRTRENLRDIQGEDEDVDQAVSRLIELARGDE